MELSQETCPCGSSRPYAKCCGLWHAGTAAKLIGEAAAEVEFIARSRVSNAAAVRQHERSRFVRESGAWFYVDGDVL